ncbi:hypothetical protein GCM10007977_051750 [Dactylosporangium sucinum]|uniref:Uncharacterized protein n=1 Tax=Dactylosporangium sucinum TaxID=1424081 RepID=A0A917TXW2_9ACTN|nr:hypothetical protein GCM10007977_051750 [Dactylosporangium sucinum]
MQGLPAAAPQPRGGTWTSVSNTRTAWAIAAGSRSGHRSASRLPSSANVSGSAARIRAPSATISGTIAGSPGRRPKFVAHIRSPTTATSGRTARASRAIIRWLPGQRGPVQRAAVEDLHAYAGSSSFDLRTIGTDRVL